MAKENGIEELLQLLLKQSLERAILLIDTQGVVLRASAGAEYIFDCSCRDIVGQHLERFFTPEDIDGGLPAHERSSTRLLLSSRGNVVDVDIGRELKRQGAGRLRRPSFVAILRRRSGIDTERENRKFPWIADDLSAVRRVSNLQTPCKVYSFSKDEG